MATRRCIRELGTLADFDLLVAGAREHGLEIALDFAVQCSADHPWLREHPEWFHRRPDGTLKYAENPPKRYQDIYNVDFESENWSELWRALRGVVEFWVDRGVRIFRVDNPHTKPLRLLGVADRGGSRTRPRRDLPREAFTRAATMRTLAKVGFSQSYTYFTWKNTRRELEEYVTELAHPAIAAASCAPTSSSTPPTSSTEYLQRAGPAGVPRHVSCWRRRCRRATASTPASSASRTSLRARARRSTSTRRSTRSSSASSTARCCR